MKHSVASVEVIESHIFLIRGHRVMIDAHLAGLYEVETKALVRAVKRNLERFPDGFMFQINDLEFESLRCQIGTLKPAGRGQHRKYLPYVFTEQGIAMLSSVLRSKRAIQVNIGIMQTFVKMREAMIAHKDLSRRLNDMERKYDKQFRVVFDAIRQIMEPPPAPPKRPIGFIRNKE
ncbi:MAG: ORF6N domain-containing protein [Pseudomonadota bacterium]